MTSEPKFNSDRFQEALRRFDEANAQDPNQLLEGDRSQPKEWVYARWLSEWVDKLQPDASEPLRLAARCQHLCRWKIPRSEYPMTRPGYLKWRADLKSFHARQAGDILRDVGYPEETIRQVQELNLKKNFPADPESRVLEDALCLVFLEHQLAELAEKTDEEKVINALQKSWKKMTSAAHTIALQLPLSPREKELVHKALESS